MIKKQQKELIGLEKITKFLKILFNSGNLLNEKPISTILVSPPSNGKTLSTRQFTHIESFKKIMNPHIKVVTDATAYGILKRFENQLRTGEIRYIVIPDLLNVLARKKTSVDTMILFINSSSEDGISDSSTYAYEIRERIPPFGWVTCVTQDAYNKKKKQLDQIGLSSRFLKIEYKYSLETINRILKNIVNEEKIEIPQHKINNKKVKIEGDKKIFEKVLVYSNLLCKGKPSEAIRIQKNLQTFLKASAYTRGAKKVTETDLKILEEMIDLIK